MVYQILVAVLLFGGLLFLLLPAYTNEKGFYHGASVSGQAPSLFTLIFSQVTTWIFARSLMNAAILGFHFGPWGVLAYAAYYLSFFTGGLIVDRVRFGLGYGSIQAFFFARYGRAGTFCYNALIIIRLISELFANLIVIGLIFGGFGSQTYFIAIILLSLFVLLYSMKGGLSAALKTDVLQMGLFLMMLAALSISMMVNQYFDQAAVFDFSFDISQPGPILFFVALLQVWSYPLHDPVMMDRGFLADRKTTQRSFLHAGWISIICIVLFGLLGVFAGVNAVADESMNQALSRLLGAAPMLILNAALIISAMSTLDSALASSSKLIVINMRCCRPTINNGRRVMLVFMLAALAFVFYGDRDLFSAVAVSGTASLFLFPVIMFNILAGRCDIPCWSLLISFCIAIAGAVLYFTESSAYSVLLGDWHKYTKLLFITLAVLLSTSLIFAAGLYCERAKRI